MLKITLSAFLSPCVIEKLLHVFLYGYHLDLTRLRVFAMMSVT